MVSPNFKSHYFLFFNIKRQVFKPAFLFAYNMEYIQYSYLDNGIYIGLTRLILVAHANAHLPIQEKKAINTLFLDLNLYPTIKSVASDISIF